MSGRQSQWERVMTLTRMSIDLHCKYRLFVVYRKFMSAVIFQKDKTKLLFQYTPPKFILPFYFEMYFQILI